MKSASVNGPAERRRTVLVALLPLSLALASIGIACAHEDTLDVGPHPDEPQVIPGADASGDSDLTSELDAETDGGKGAGSGCSASGICIASIPVDGRVNLTSVWGSGPSDVWAVGTAGTIVHYDGTKWERAALEAQDATTPFTLRGVWLERPDDVWILDGTSLRHTTGWSGPATTEWTRYAYASNTPVPSAIRGKDGTIWMTRQRASASGAPFARLGAWVDGGPSSTQTLGSSSISLAAVAVGRTDEAWGVGGNRVLRAVAVPPAVDGGAPTWRADELDSRTTRMLNGVWADETDVWIVGESGVVRHTSTTDTPLLGIVETGFDSDLYGVFGFDAANVWAVGEQGTILHWDGTTWTKVATPLDALADRPRLFGVWGSSPNDVWFAGAGVMLHLERTGP